MGLEKYLRPNYIPTQHETHDRLGTDWARSAYVRPSAKPLFPSIPVNPSPKDRELVEFLANAALQHTIKAGDPGVGGFRLNAVPKSNLRMLEFLLQVYGGCHPKPVHVLWKCFIESLYRATEREYPGVLRKEDMDTAKLLISFGARKITPISRSSLGIDWSYYKKAAPFEVPASWPDGRVMSAEGLSGDAWMDAQKYLVSRCSFLPNPEWGQFSRLWD